MKILQIIYSLSSGGAERFVVDLCNEMVEQGHEVLLCVVRTDTISNNDFYKNELSNEIKYINLGIPEGFSLSYIIKFYDVIKKNKPDIVHCHLNLVNYIFPLALFFRKKNFIYTVHNDAPKEVHSKLEYWIRRLFFQISNFNVITISAETSESFKNYYRTPMFTEIYNGRQIPKCSIEKINVDNYFKELRKNSETVFLHIGRCVPQKNQLMLINTFNRLLADRRSVTLLIIGNGFESSFGLELKKIASNKILFLGSIHNVADYYLNADAFCLSSIYEGMPISLIEALACGCVPICTPVGGIINTIRNGVTGFISKSLTEEDYYQSVKEYIENPKLVRKEKLVNYYNENFSITECVEKHIKLYLSN